MNDRPTPETDKFTNFMRGTDDVTHLVALDLFARQLERERDEAREQLAAERALADRLANQLAACRSTFGLPPFPEIEAWKEARK